MPTRKILIFCLLCALNVKAEQILFDFETGFNVSVVETQDAKASLHTGGLQIETAHNKDWPGVTLKAPGGKWDLGAGRLL